MHAIGRGYEGLQALGARVMTTPDLKLVASLESKVRQLVPEYLKRGWPVIPLEARSKEIVTPGFDMKSRLRFKVDDFAENNGVGLRSVDGHNVLDLDSPEAIFAADTFIP